MTHRPTVQDRFWTLAAQAYLVAIESLLKRNVPGNRNDKALRLLDALGEEISNLEEK